MADSAPFTGQDMVLWIPDDVPCFDAGLALALPPAGPELAAFLDMYREAERWARGRRADLDGAPALIAGGLRRIPIVWPQVLRCCAPAFRQKTLHAMAERAGSLKLSGRPFDAGSPCVLLEDEAETLLGLYGADFNDCTGTQAFFCIQTQSDVMFRTALMLSCPSKTNPAPACVTVSIDAAELCMLLAPYASREVSEAARQADRLLRQFCRDAREIALLAGGGAMPPDEAAWMQPLDGNSASLKQCAVRLAGRLGGIAAAMPASGKTDGEKLEPAVRG